MNDQSAKAYAKAYGVIERAMARKGSPLSAHDRDTCIDRPFDGFTPLYLRAVKMGALTETDERLIGLFLDEVDPRDDLHAERPIPIPQQGVWELEYEHWRELYTPGEVATKLGVTKQRVSALIKNGQLDSVKIGGRYLVPNYSVTRRLYSQDAD